MTLSGLTGAHPAIPATDKYYQFDLDRMRDFFVFWDTGFAALMLEGDPAAGKTSWIEQIHARLGVPLLKIACTPTTDAQQLYGQYLPKADGGLQWVDGPVTTACRHGWSVLLDEFNTLDPGVSLGLNAVLERKSYTIPETGEVINPVLSTRFFATQNSVDSKLMMAGRNVQDDSNCDRFMYLEVDYLKPEIEKNIVKSMLADSGCTDQSVLSTMSDVVVTCANKIRNAFRSGEEAIEKPLSTRTLLRWATMAYRLQGLQSKGVSPLHYSLARSVKMSPEMLQACKQMLTAVTGFDEKLGKAAP